MINLDIIATSIGIIQSILFILLILSKRSIRGGDKILLLWFAVFCVHLCLILLLDTFQTPLILIPAKTLVLLHGPFFLAYARLIFGELNKSLFAHFAPFAVFLGLGFLITKTSSVEQYEMALAASKLLSLIGYPAFLRYCKCQTNSICYSTHAGRCRSSYIGGDRL